MTQPTILANGECKLVFANSTALSLLTKRDGLELRNGMLCVPAADSRSFKATIAHACHQTSPKAETLLIRRRADSPLLISAAPVREVDGTRWALILISGIQAPGNEVRDRLHRLFGLSKAEADIALAITAGRPVAEIACTRQVSVDTVRTQLKAVASKLGCSRQAEIAVLVSTISHTGLA